MKFLKLFSLSNLAALSDWLEESGELLVDIYYPHSAGGSYQYFVNSIDELKQLIQKETCDEISITIFREKQYPLRGIASAEMLEKALTKVKEGEWYSIISFGDSFLNKIIILEASDTLSEMPVYFKELSGQRIGFGQNPFDIYDEEWIRTNSDKVFTLSVTKNQNYYEKYTNLSKKFQWLKRFWSE